MRRVLAMGILSVLMTTLVMTGSTASAIGLKVQPLQYKAAVKNGENLQGFIDVSNPSSVAVNVSVSVQGFRQINNDGGLEFYQDERLSAGIRPEQSSLELGSREAIRLYFTIAGKTLPQGDIHAALFFTTEPAQAQSGVGQSVRVGTLLSLVNETPGVRKATLTGFSAPLLQLDDTINGEYRIKNTGPKDTGFYPTVEVTAWPNGSARQVEGSLVFGGRERTNDVTYKTGYGIHRINVKYGQSSASRWVISVAPWMVVLGLFVLVIVAIELLLIKRRRKSLNKI